MGDGKEVEGERERAAVAKSLKRVLRFVCGCNE
jgi:hypothetical protein